MKKTIKGYSTTLVNELESLHSEGSSSSCQYCWKPLNSENYCKSCETTSDIESDPFLNVDLIVE
jgi:predicted amidophosphoribosyltransferase